MRSDQHKKNATTLRELRLQKRDATRGDELLRHSVVVRALHDLVVNQINGVRIAEVPSQLQCTTNGLRS
jgi:hypothetical protein